MKCGQSYSIQNIARLYFLMNKTLINLRSKKNMGPSPLTGLWVQWQCNDNEDLCHHNWDGSMKYSFITWWVPQPRLGNEMGSGKFLRPDWMAENMAAWNIPPSLWCGVPNVSVQEASRANREGISQQTRSAWISAPLMIIEENVKMKNREGVWDTF